MGNDLCEGGLADARWAPEDEGTDSPTVDHAAQHSIRANKVLLTNIAIECGGAHAFG